jgi:Amiloride-sensitive sodium channel
LWFQQCPLPCSKTVYNVKLLKYHKNSNIGLEVEKAKDIHNLAIYFKFDYETFAVEEFTETLIYDTGNFLTQLGGNLGLFLGFSCFSLLQGIMNIFVHY